MNNIASVDKRFLSWNKKKKKKKNIFGTKIVWLCWFFIRSFTSDTSVFKQREKTFVNYSLMLCEKKNRPLMFSVDRNIPTLGSTVSVENKASWNGGPSGWKTNDGFYLSGMQDKLAVALPIKFSFFTICYGSMNLYFWEQKNEPFAHISLRIRAVTTHKCICQSFMFLKCEGWSFDCPTGRAA